MHAHGSEMLAMRALHVFVAYYVFVVRRSNDAEPPLCDGMTLSREHAQHDTIYSNRKTRTHCNRCVVGYLSDSRTTHSSVRVTRYVIGNTKREGIH